jgi:hypothetical protein
VADTGEDVADLTASAAVVEIAENMTMAARIVRSKTSVLLIAVSIIRLYYATGIECQYICVECFTIASREVINATENPIRFYLG